MPGIESPARQCGLGGETAAHAIAHCPRFAEIRCQIANPHTGQVDIRGLTNSSKRVRRLARWFIQLQILLQFSLAEKLLYRSRERGPE